MSSQAGPCGTCGALANREFANTGRDEALPAAKSGLSSVGSGCSSDLLRCPSCTAIFHLEDDSSQAGSGNNDSKSLTRLGETEAGLVRSVLALIQNPADAAGVFRRAFDSLPEPIASQLLSGIRFKLPPETMDLLVPDLLDLLIRTRDWMFGGLLLDHARRDRRRAERVRELLAQDPRPKEYCANRLAEDCEELLRHPQPPPG